MAIEQATFVNCIIELAPNEVYVECMFDNCELRGGDGSAFYKCIFVNCHGKMWTEDCLIGNCVFDRCGITLRRINQTMYIGGGGIELAGDTRRN